jgi:hypothetical protein
VAPGVRSRTSDASLRRSLGHRGALARRLGIAGAVVVALVLLVPLGSATVAGATGHAHATTSTTYPPNQPQVPIPRIIPLPNSGHAPRDAYDPGGWGQYAVFFGIVFGVGLIALLIWRDVRKGRRRQAARESTRSDPVAETSENSPDSSARQ